MSDTIKKIKKEVEAMKKLAENFDRKQFYSLVRQVESLRVKNWHSRRSKIFVEHIEKHLLDMGIEGKVQCKICGKDIDQIYKEETEKEAKKQAGEKE